MTIDTATDTVRSTTSISLGLATDYFDVNSAAGLAVWSGHSLPASYDVDDHQPTYAFVAGYNRYIKDAPSNDPLSNPNRPGGSNIGLIRDPFGPAPKLVAATLPIPFAYMDNLVLSANGRYLYAAYRSIGAVFVFDAEKMILLAETGNPTILETTPLDEIDPSIRINANYALLKTVREIGYTDFVFGVPPGATDGPIAVGGTVQGLAILQPPVALALSGTTAGHLGDVIKVDLKSLLAEKTGIAAADLVEFDVDRDSFGGGHVAVYRADDNSVTVITAGMQSNGSIAAGGEFKKTGAFYFIPDIDVDAARR